ncbi:MAG: hypothetical protein OEZ57_10325 [Nitrospirota bacterium]|nr:hypothetical protein [Nitrospirota bacterium]MDH5586764.1 hypothetical protein [Nitrospirota bacterium]MDH5775296.1 hypothetical protein [Nitrospirota bacterium]
MRERKFSFVVLVTVLALVFGAFSGSVVSVFADSKPDLELIVKVNEKGFFDEKDKLLGPKNPLKVPKGAIVKVVFVFDEGVKSLAIGDVHQIAITADDSWTVESDKIWFFNGKSKVTFVAGENGRTQYRGYCIIDCIGMDHLNNLVIHVV